MAEGEWIETDVPARMDRLPWSRWHWLIVTALGVNVDSRWIGGHAGRCAGRTTLKNPAALGLTDRPGRPASASFYLVGSGPLGRAGLRLRHGPAGAQKNSFTSRCCSNLLATAATALSWNFRLLRRLPLPDRRGHRRGVRGHQLRHRRTDPRPPPRAGGSHHQLDVLDRRGPGRGGDGDPARSEIPAGLAGLAVRVRHRRGAGAGRAVLPPLGARKPALADDPRPHGRGREASWPRSRAKTVTANHPDQLFRRPKAKKPACASGRTRPGQKSGTPFSHEHRKS